MSNNDELCLNDPKKTLRSYFEVRNCIGGTFGGEERCQIELPVDDDFGRPIGQEEKSSGVMRAGNLPDSRSV